MKKLLIISIPLVLGYFAYKWVKKNLNFDDLTIDWDV